MNDGFVEPAVAAIIKGARTGDVGDGKTFIVQLADCVRIRSGERGNAAFG